MLDIFDYCIKIKNDGKQETNNKLEKININILNEKNNNNNDTKEIKFFFDDNFISFISDSLDKNYFDVFTPLHIKNTDLQ